MGLPAVLPFLNLLGAQCFGWTSLVARFIEALQDTVPTGTKPFNAKDSVVQPAWNMGV